MACRCVWVTTSYSTFVFPFQPSVFSSSKPRWSWSTYSKSSLCAMVLRSNMLMMYTCQKVTTHLFWYQRQEGTWGQDCWLEDVNDSQGMVHAQHGLCKAVTNSLTLRSRRHCNSAKRWEIYRANWLLLDLPRRWGAWTTSQLTNVLCVTYLPFFLHASEKYRADV